MAFLLSLMLFLPTEADGGFDSVFLFSPSQAANTQIDASFSIDGEDFANFARSRCDFLDLVLGDSPKEQFETIYNVASFDDRKDHIHISLLSFLLLNLPPPART